MFRRIVNAVEVLVAIGAALVVILLFANEPELGGGAVNGNGAPTAAGLYAANCASCHGPDGGGGLAPQLSDGKAAERFPDIADEIEIVTRGKVAMPAFGGSLSAREIRRVVEYTRTL